jgi:hypothetical protein
VKTSEAVKVPPPKVPEGLPSQPSGAGEYRRGRIILRRVRI